MQGKGRCFCSLVRLRITPINCVKKNHLGRALICSPRRDEFYCRIDFSAALFAADRVQHRSPFLKGEKCQSLTAAL